MEKFKKVMHIIFITSIVATIGFAIYLFFNIPQTERAAFGIQVGLIFAAACIVYSNFID